MSVTITKLRRKDVLYSIDDLEDIIMDLIKHHYKNEPDKFHQVALDFAQQKYEFRSSWFGDYECSEIVEMVKESKAKDIESKTLL